MNDGVFVLVPTTTCVLQVPKGTKNAYQQADQWKDFVNIEESQEDIVLGDLDGSCDINGTDLNILINIILGKDNADNYGGRANIDGEGGVDGTDLNRLINFIIGK